MPMPTEKIMDWVFKITTALVLPTVAWTLKMSNDVAVLREKVATLTAEASKDDPSQRDINTLAIKVAVNEATLKGVKERADRISRALERIESYIQSRRP